jgi:hypothetical protein
MADDPFPEGPHARLEVSDSPAVVSGELAYAIVNDGTTNLLYGAGYAFQRPDDHGKWSYVPLTLAFAAWGAQLRPGETSLPLRAHIPESLTKGPYRLVISVTVLESDGRPARDENGGPVDRRVVADFIVA